jgi:methylmalonyl-CoA carboxyltransferase small subunit
VKLRITVEGKSYDVDVEVLPEEAPSSDEDFEMRVPPLVLKAPPSDFTPEDRICRSPIAGVVISVIAVPGQQVRKDDPLITIEAMKMQSTIGATMDGTVQAIRVNAGQPVKTGQVLVELA